MKPATELGGLFASPNIAERSTSARTLTTRQKRLIALLKSGSKHSVIDIANALHIGDPRSDIRDLRRMGIVVNDEWVTSAYGNRYKLFWIGRD